MLPTKTTIRIEKVKGRHRYFTPGGDFWGATSPVDEMDGTKIRGIVGWAVARAKEGKSHDDEYKKAGVIGTEAHAAIEKLTRDEQPGELSDEARRAVDLWWDWWGSFQAEPIATEQPVWSVEHGFAGTIDVIVKKDGETGIIDYKTGSGVYFGHHLQVAAYLYAAREFIPVHWAKIVHVPVKPGERLKIVELGQLNGKQFREHSKLLKAFLGLKTAWDVFHGE